MKYAKTTENHHRFSNLSHEEYDYIINLCDLLGIIDEGKNMVSIRDLSKGSYVSISKPNTPAISSNGIIRVYDDVVANIILDHLNHDKNKAV